MTIKKSDVSASIVIYNPKINLLTNLIETILESNLSIILYIIDNSKYVHPLLKTNYKNKNFIYIHNPSNPGFGASHNYATELAIRRKSNYHFIINPDIILTKDILNTLVFEIKREKNIGIIMPKILNFDGSTQNLPKLLPSPLWLVIRKIKWPNFYYFKMINTFELREVSQKLIFNSPILSGCFMLVNLKYFEDVGKFDEQFFMYFEDWDLSRRINKKYQTHLLSFSFCISLPRIRC